MGGDLNKYWTEKHHQDPDPSRDRESEWLSLSPKPASICSADGDQLHPADNEAIICLKLSLKWSRPTDSM